MRRAAPLVVFALLCVGDVSASLTPGVLAAGQSSLPAAALNDEAIEAFLLNASIGARRNAGAGVTDSTRATLTDGAVTHDAQIQAVDITKDRFEAGKASEVGFRDSYRYNIAAYRLSRLLGMDNVPVSVERRVDGKAAAVTWWLDDVLMTEKERAAKRSMGPQPVQASQQLQMMHVFDELIQNKDRNGGNAVWGGDWRLWLIDHTRAFRTGKDLIKPAGLLRCDRAFLERLRRLTGEAVEQATADVLTSAERAALLTRRDRIVAHYDERIGKAGEEHVLFGP
jgi:hypothetical protein